MELVPLHRFFIRAGSGSIALIQAIHPEDVNRTHLGGSANDLVVVRDGDDGWLPVPGESKPSIVHDRVVVIGSTKVPCLDDPEIMLHSRNDILQQDADILIPVRPGLFMVEAQGVEQLMLDDGLEDTTLATQRHHLGITTTSNKRETP